MNTLDNEEGLVEVQDALGQNELTVPAKTNTPEQRFTIQIVDDRTISINGKKVTYDRLLEEMNPDDTYVQTKAKTLHIRWDEPSWSVNFGPDGQQITLEGRMGKKGTEKEGDSLLVLRTHEGVLGTIMPASVLLAMANGTLLKADFDDPDHSPFIRRLAGE